MSAKDAYIKAGYKSNNPRGEAYKLRQRDTINELIEQTKAERSQSIDDRLALEEEKTFEKLFEVRDLPLDKDTYFAIIKASVELIDRRRGKAPQPVNHGGQDGNPIKIDFEYFDTPEEKDEDVDDSSKTISE